MNDADSDDIAAQVRAELCGPGGPWETAYEDVLGEQHLVFVNRHRSLRDMLAADCDRWGERECLVLDDQRLTYDDVHACVLATAARLRDEFGVEPGDRVGILAANSPQWVIAFFAITHLGAIAAALNGWWTAAEIDHAIDLIEPSLLIGDTRRLARAGSLPAHLRVLDIDARPSAFGPGAPLADPPAIDEDDPALILFTSGTTGRSKAALISHRGLVAFVDSTTHNGAEKKLVALRGLGIDPGSLPEDRAVVLNTSPLFHISGLPAGVLMNLRAGATIVFRQGRFDPADVLRLIEQEGVTSWTAIGTMGPLVFAHPDLATRDTSTVTRLSSGGAHLSEHMQAQIREHFPQAAMAIGQGYGSSESVGVITSIGGPKFAENPTATGEPCMGFEIEIRDENDRPVPDGVEGEVHVRSAATMLRYWGDPDATAETIKAGRWLAMGDIGRMENGMLYLNSRARDMILRSGENVYPVEIEHRLEAHPSVAEAAVIGVDHPDMGQEVKAVVVPAPGAAFEPEVLAEWCAETLASYKVPAHWEERRDPLPRTATGKVVKGVLTGERELSGHQD